jgi:hypothetical protein
MYSTSIINNDEEMMKRAKGWNQRSIYASSKQDLYNASLKHCYLHVGYPKPCTQRKIYASGRQTRASENRPDAIYVL